ncbi:hypothetical protein LINGRAPRIM_LOCUS2002 [Linum grandiflorum]
MHLWPSIKLRDSFSIDYLRRLEWNLHRMKVDKKKKQRLLEDGADQDNGASGDQGEEDEQEGVSFVCREIFLILSCCYCCFCCGG